MKLDCVTAENLETVLKETSFLLRTGNFGKALGELLPFARADIAASFVEVGLLYELSAEADSDLSYPAIQEAMHWYRRSIETTDEKYAYLGLGRILVKRSLSRDKVEKGLEFLRVAASRTVPEADTLLGVCYEQGVGVDVDLNRAKSYYSAAGDQGFLWPILLLSKLEFRTGNYRRALWLRVKGARLAWKIAGENPRDPRLWNIRQSGGKV